MYKRPNTKLTIHTGIDILEARGICFYLFDKEGKELPRRYFEPREVGNACIMEIIEEFFQNKLQVENPEYYSYTYSIHTLGGKKALTERFSNPVHVAQFNRKEYGAFCRKAEIGIWFHDTNTNLIDQYK